MRTIKIIDALHLNEDSVNAKTTNGRYQTVHLRQGDLDGACAVYATMMILIMIKAAKYKDISVDAVTGDKRKSIERLKKELLESKGLHRDGNYFFSEEFDNIQDMLKRSYSKYVTSVHIKDDVVPAIVSEIENDNPVLISYKAEGGGAHALVAIGIEVDEKTNQVSKIFCLDPGYAAPKFTYWNSVIDLTEYKGKYNHRNFTETGYCTYIKLEDILIITKR
ncbi:MAG: hypothetical protein IR153_08175 [Flavobacterium sp.]|nr:hypothetical protein [Flavobacterium sp.]